MEVAADRVIDETFCSLGFATSLIAEYNIVIPPSLYLQISTQCLPAIVTSCGAG